MSAALPDDAAHPTGLLAVLLDVSLTGVLLLRPLYDASGEHITDLAWVRLNPAAQQMLGLPECPRESFRTLFPTAKEAGVFDFYRAAFLSGQVAHRQNNYQYDGLNGYYLLVARRYEGLLVVSFTDTNDRPRTAVEEALRLSQARELAARVQAEEQRQRLYQALMQLPAHINLMQGPSHVFELVNPPYQQLFPGRPLLGWPIRTVLPELAGQGFFEVIDDVYRSGRPAHLPEAETWADFEGTGQPERRYYNAAFLPMTDGQGQVTGLLNVAFDVTGQVAARHQVQELNEELASINEELRASNEEYLATNTALSESQLLLRQLNQELEARVQQRTQQLAHAQAAAEAQRQQLASIFEQAPVAITVLRGPKLLVESANAAISALWGRAATHTAGRPYFEAVPDTAGQGFEEVLAGVLRTGEPYFLNEAAVTLDRAHTGQPRVGNFNFVFQPLFDPAGGPQPVGIVAIGTEVTEQVQARQRIEASARQLRLLTDALPVLISYLDRERRYQFNNEAYRAWFGQDPAALLGQPVRAVVGEQAYAATVGYIDRALAGERLSFEATMPYREGFTRHIRTSYVPDVRAGEVLGFYALVQDVTEQVEARQQVQRLNEELVATNAALAAINERMQATNEELHDANTRLLRTNADLDTFVYAASHDLKAPIANIEGLLNALRDYLPTEAQEPMVPRLVGMMEAAILRFQETVGHLTDILRQQHAPEQPGARVDLARVLEDVRLDLLPLLESTHAELVTDLADAPQVRFSTRSLRSVLFNLLSNAVKYRAPGRPPLVRISTHCAGQQVVLQVQDNGLGLSETQQGQLFAMFRRLHTHVEGSGVGLYLIKRLLENAGGTIAVQSQPGVGSTFTVTLPRA